MLLFEIWCLTEFFSSGGGNPSDLYFQHVTASRQPLMDSQQQASPGQLEYFYQGRQLEYFYQARQ